MNEEQQKQVTKLFHELSTWEPEKSTEYIFQRIIDCALLQLGIEIDSVDVSDALMSEAARIEEGTQG